MSNLITLLREQPLLLLFVVAGIGYVLGQVRVGGVSIGVAAVLFVGLAFGALDPDLKLPELVYQLGLIIFVYTIGLSSGPGFFASFGRRGLRDNLFVLVMLLAAWALALAILYLFGLTPGITAGLFTGSLTNTPALAGVLDTVKVAAGPGAPEGLLNEPVIGYSVGYPVGVLGMILTIYLVQRLWRVDYAQDATTAREWGALTRRLISRTVKVTRPEATQSTIQDLTARHKWHALFGRHKHAGGLALVGGGTQLELGDQVTVVGPEDDLAPVVAFLGEVSDEQLELDRSEFDFRRIFVSNPDIAGQRLRDLNLPQRFGAMITRVRRGDAELLPDPDTALELGDRVRVLTRRENMQTVSDFFGDSYRVVSEVDILPFSLGLAVGLLIGLVPLPLPGGATLRLGLAGGPLIVALILGGLRRTGPLVWNIPYSANLTLRQIGLILFLAGIGTRSGYAFLSTLTQSGGLEILVGGVLVTCLTGLATLWIGRTVLKIPMGILTGMLAGLQTQPAVLGFAQQQADNDLPNIGYTTVYPLATIAKVVLAQFIILFVR